MSSFADRAFEVLVEFHQDVDDRARRTGSGVAGLSMLFQQLPIFQGVFKDHASSIKDSINATQKEINREFVPVIQAAVAPAYTDCVNEHGPGSFARMKAAMDAHLSERRFSMFQECVDNVQHQLFAMIKSHEQQLGDRVDETFLAIRRDYLSVLGPSGVPQGELLPKSQRILRAQVLKLLDTVENAFRGVAGLPLIENKENTGTERIKADTTIDDEEVGKPIKDEPEDPQGVEDQAPSSDPVSHTSEHPSDESDDQPTLESPLPWRESAFADDTPSSEGPTGFD
ncbi:MAG: hypothetical protein Q9220_005711 [cf. Caloplaca sp. 1 TL-2023]